MKRNLLEQLSAGDLKIIQRVGSIADQKNISSYLAGGIVRDLLLKRENHDLDIVVVGDSAAVAKLIAEKLSAQVVIHSRFKTATVTLESGNKIDFAMARKEIYSQPGALPEVERGDIVQDQYRRDFSINCLFISLNAATFGKLIDFCGGYRDIQSKEIRVLHSMSFMDDPTRLFRAVRFEQRLNFRINDHTLKLIKQALKKDSLGYVKAQRLFNEFKKLFDEQDPVANLKRLKQLKLLQFIDPLMNMNIKYMSSLQKESEAKVKLMKKYPNWLILFAALLKGQEMQTIQRIADKFQLSMKAIENILESLSRHDTMSALSQSKAGE